jgi:type II secretory pathway pseudopilin PulG
MGMLLAVTIIGLGLSATGELYSRSQLRERERELLFVGDQYRNAIAAYYLGTPGGAHTYPQALEDLLLDRRYPTVQRHLRRLYADPLTGKAEWGIVSAPQGGIMGVYSLAAGKPIKHRGFRDKDRSFEDAVSYADWKFFFQPVPRR